MAIKTTLSNKSLLVIGSILLVVLLIVIVVRVSGNFVSTSTDPRASESIEAIDPQTGRKYTFRGDGFVTFVDENGNSVSEVWDQAKIAAFFEYIKQNFVVGGEGNYQVIINGQSGSSGSGGDELIDTATGGGNGGDTSQYFATPTPVPTPYNLPIQGSNPTTQPTLPPPAPSWCKFWRLSYCADPLESAPTPSPTSSSGIIPSSCNETGNQTTGRTVITNELCVGSEDIVEP